MSKNSNNEDETNRLRRQRDLILAATGDGLYGVDTKGKTTFVNPTAARMCGFTVEEMLSAGLHDLIHHTKSNGCPYPVHECPIYGAATDGKIHRESKEVFWRKDGSCFPVEYVSTPIWDEGKLVGAVVSFRDITESKLAEEKTRQLQSELQHISRLCAMGEMASGMAHELNQPLSAIMNYVQASKTLLETKGEEGRENAIKFMGKAVAQASRAGEIIKGLRSFVDKDDSNKMFVNINDIIEEAIVLTIPSGIKEHLHLEQKLAKKMPEALLYKIKIQQVVVNLVKNAIEAMNEQQDCHLKISTQVKNSHIEFFVSDNGSGLTEQQLENVFQSFVTTKEKGMGVGLSICRSIIEEHNGKLWAENNEAGGATFFFKIPIITKEEM